MYVTKIKLEHIRGFSNETLDFTKKTTNRNELLPRMRTVILGKNGTCKTTLLRCIAIGLSDEGDASGLITEPVGTLISEGKNDATITIELSPGNGGSKTTVVTTTLSRSEKGEDYIENKDWKNKPNQIFLCGYGAGRSSEGSDIKRPYRIIDSVYTLFWYEEPLIGTELTMRRLRDYRGSKFYERTMNGIKKALGLKSSDSFDLPRGGGITVSGPTIGNKIPFEGWADGYRMTFNWILDLYAWAMKAGCITATGGVKGIVLIDEIDQHLHPSMQTTLLDRLSKMCLDLQVITTTHSPMVALGAKPSEVIALKRKGKKVLISDIPDFQGCSVEDIISNADLFDSDIYSPETSRMLLLYRKLASIVPSKRTGSEKAKLQFLRKKLEAQEILENKESKIDKKLHALIKKYQL